MIGQFVGALVTGALVAFFQFTLHFSLTDSLLMVIALGVGSLAFKTMDVDMSAIKSELQTITMHLSSIESNTDRNAD
jgi:hypothetical protein